VQPRKIVRYLGLVVAFVGLFMATSLVWAFLERADYPGGVRSWGLSVLVTVGLGGAAWLWGRSAPPTVRRSRRAVGGVHDGELNRREAVVIVSMTWILCAAFAGLPLMLDGMIGDPVDAMFETMSGFTTTGSTILSEIEGNSKASLWWRSLIQWLGGMGIIVLFVAIFPQAGSGGRKLFESEAPGPTKDQLKPRVRETGLVLYKIYAGFTVAQTLLLMLEGMSFFEAACHAFTTMATGGFSTRNASVAGFDSAAIDWTITFFMLCAGVNFGLYYEVQRGRGLRVFRDPELFTYLSITVLATLAASWVLLPIYNDQPLEALRYGAFQVASIVTSTGYGTADFNLWPEFARTLLILLMFIGGMGGSTAGGLKVSRAVIVASAAVGEVRHVLHPRAVFSTRLGAGAVEDRVVRQVMALFVIFVALLFTGTLVLSAVGVPLETAFSAAMTALCNSGPALNELGPAGNFSALPDFAKVTLTALMMLGRLEFYTVLVLFVPGFWKAR
jgi:trk system potassium uptake protein TrkH